MFHFIKTFSELWGFHQLRFSVFFCLSFKLFTYDLNFIKFCLKKCQYTKGSAEIQSHVISSIRSSSHYRCPKKFSLSTHTHTHRNYSISITNFISCFNVLFAFLDFVVVFRFLLIFYFDFEELSSFFVKYLLFKFISCFVFFCPHMFVLYICISKKCIYLRLFVVHHLRWQWQVIDQVLWPVHIFFLFTCLSFLS